jgi:hypothetical protein
MATKMVLFYNQFNAGFSETFYSPNDEPISVATSVSNAFLQKAVKFRAISVFLKAIRFSRTDGERRSFLQRPYPKAQGTRFETAEVGADIVSTSAVYALQSAAGKHRRIWLRGLADADVRRDEFGNDIPSATLQKDVDAYFKGVFALGFAIKFVKRPPTDGLTWRKVGAVQRIGVTNPNRSTFFTLPDAPLLTVGTVVSFRGIPSTLPRFPRKAEILAVDTIDGVTNYTIAYQLPGGVSVGPKNLQFTAYTPAYSVMDDYAFERFGEHKTGRPFGSLRGRSRAVAVLS